MVEDNLSGDLQVVSGTSIKMVRVNGGKVSYATSNLREDRLGESMLSHALIDERLFARASATMQTDQCRFGEALLKLGKLTEAQLHKELAVQMQRIVLSLFRLNAGLYTFDKSASEETDALPFALSVPPLLLKGLRRVRDDDGLTRVMPEETTRVRVAREPLYAFEPQKLSDLERSVLERAGQTGATLGEIVRALRESRAPVLRSCYSLLTVGLLESVPGVEQKELSHEGEMASTAALRLSYEDVRARAREVRKLARGRVLAHKLDDLDGRLATAYSRILNERNTPAGLANTSEASAKVLGRRDEELPDPVRRNAAREVELDPAVKRARRSQLERDARLHLQVKDFRGAIPLLCELVSLDSDHAPYRAMLAQSMQHHPSTRSNAEHHFVEAVRLAPENVKMRLALAVYYKRTGQHARAVSAFQQVLMLDPKNETAQRFLLANGEPTGVKALFKKIFG
jgi:tetratricopeptide (TPR) repeat protein